MCCLNYIHLQNTASEWFGSLKEKKNSLYWILCQIFSRNVLKNSSLLPHSMRTTKEKSLPLCVPNEINSAVKQKRDFFCPRVQILPIIRKKYVWPVQSFKTFSCQREYVLCWFCRVCCDYNRGQIFYLLN